MEFLNEIFVENKENMLEDAPDNQKLWVFGYGSILWKTGFKYNSKRVGHINGYVRRFWQGNTTHRGTKEKPGRVATLIPENQGQVWGVAYELVGEQMINEAMKHLYSRECKLGGYIMHQEHFYPVDCSCSPIVTLVFRATEESDLYLGSAPEFQLASQIVDCKGPSGHNVEYVLLLAMYLRKHIPMAQDDHLSALEKHISEILLNRGVEINELVRTSYIPEEVTFDHCDICAESKNQNLSYDQLSLKPSNHEIEHNIYNETETHSFETNVVKREWKRMPSMSYGHLIQ